MTGDIDIEPVCRGSSETLATTVTDDTMMEAGVVSSPSGTSVIDEYRTSDTYGTKAFNLTTSGTRISGSEENMVTVVAGSDLRSVTVTVWNSVCHFVHDG